MSNEEIEGAVARCAEHARVLRAGAAPHQQPLAADLETLVKIADRTVLEPVRAELELANTTIESMKDQLTKAREERDNLRGELNTAQKEITLAQSTILSLEQERYNLRARLGAIEGARTQDRTEIETLNQTIVELQAKNDDLKAAKPVNMAEAAGLVARDGKYVDPKELGVHSAGGETHADLKAKSKAQQVGKIGGHKH